MACRSSVMAARPPASIARLVATRGVLDSRFGRPLQVQGMPSR
ncbi:hypothetical protein ACFWBB_32450 [Streptomyces sp. NPDC060000]